MAPERQCPMTEDGEHDLSYLAGWYCRACWAEGCELEEEAE